MTGFLSDGILLLVAAELEISPEELEEEVRAGDPLTVVDIRAPEDFARWHMDAAGAGLVNVQADALTQNTEAAVAQIPTEGSVRVICAAGKTSLGSTELLRERGFDALSVRGGMIGWASLLRSDAVSIGTTTGAIQFRREARGCLSYLLVSDAEALVVDPAPGIEPYLERAEAERARITRVLDTHVHADHPSGGRALAEAASAVLHLPAGSIMRGLRYGDRLEVIEDGDRIPLGVADVRAIALPGHTTDMTGLLIDGRALAGGDSLFADSIARPDLEAGEAGAADAARTLWETLRERIGPLGDEIILLPCHYPGGRLDGPIAPTLGTVRRRLELLKAPQEEFVRQLLSDMPPRPANYLEIIAFNMGEEHPDVLSLESGGNSCTADSSWAK